MAQGLTGLYLTKWLDTASGGKVCTVSPSASDPDGDTRFFCKVCGENYKCEEEFVHNGGAPTGLVSFVSKHRHRKIVPENVLKYASYVVQYQPYVSVKLYETTISLRCNSNNHKYEEAACVLNVDIDRFVAPNGVDLQMPNEVTEWRTEHAHHGTHYSKEYFLKMKQVKHENYLKSAITIPSAHQPVETLVEINTETVKTLPTKTGRKFRK